MDEEEELLDDLSLLAFKNQLLCASIDQLKNFYKDENTFLCFLDTIAIASRKEPAFFLLSPEIKKRILEIIEIHKYSVDDEVLDYINEILVYLNAVENVSEEMVSLMVKSYIDFHESIRNTKYNEVCDFLDALAYDAIFMNSLDEGNIQNLTNHDLNISSFNYLIATSPDFFKNEEVMARAQQVLEQEKRTTKVFSKKKKNINNIKKSLKYIGEKEE